MYLSPRSAVTSGFSVVLAAAIGCAQTKAQTAKPLSQEQARPATASTAADKLGKDDPVLAGLPTFLLPVPGGQTLFGLSAGQLLQSIFESINPQKPELAARAPDKVVRALSNTASELGQNKELIETFLLGRWPVTNAEYEVFVKKMQAQKQKIRPPFHWWRYGRQDDYEKRLEDINKQFKADGKYGPKLYWERYGDELPYALKDEHGKPIDNLPVVFISYRDALRFAGWLGMRLPTEAERTRAVRGDGTQVWPWGNNKEVGDVFSEQALQQLGLGSAKGRQLKEVGSVKFAYGPYGHYDMTGQVWEFVARVGFYPIGERSKFETEWKALMKDKVGALMKNQPAWKDGVVVIKGGSYFSSSDPIQLHVDCRDKIDTSDALDVVGLRLAKSLKPGYDILVSWVSSEYNQSLFGNDQAIDFKNQVGVERYVLAKNGFPEEYHAFSFAPLNWITSEKNAALNKFEERSQLQPIPLGTIATTEKVLMPQLEANQLYTLAFRQEGMPKELGEAIKTGYKEVQAALKRAARGEKEETPAEGDKKPKGNDWHGVLAKYGLTAKDLEAADADTKLKIMRLNGGTYEIPTDTSLFLFFDNSGKFVAHLPTATGLTGGNLAPCELTFDARKGDNGERAHALLKGCLPLQAGTKRGVSFQLDFILDCPPSSATESWRLPQPTK